MDRIEKNALISARILAFIVNGGMSVQRAIDTVLGHSTYDCIVEELYHDLRAKGAAA